MAQISVSDEVKEMIDAYSKAREIGVGEAAERLINTGVSRLKALKKYADSHVPAPAKKKAKEAKAPKARKAKTSVGSKLANGKAKPPRVRKAAPKIEPETAPVMQ